MKASKPYILNVNGRLLSLDKPLVMGILNATPDSFYAASRTFPADRENYPADRENYPADRENYSADSFQWPQKEGQPVEEALRARVRQIKEEGAALIDVGACSTRPHSTPCSAAEEMERLATALRIVREEAPGLPVSVDTFRADVARFAVEEGGATLINDISGGLLDPQMHHTVSRLGVPYILTHWQEEPHPDDTPAHVLQHLAVQAQHLRDLGQCDIIADPGFGFGKTLAQNYALMRQLAAFRQLDLPLLVGISRKSMIYQLTGGTPDTALPATSALHLYALQQGAHILRVHDVRAAIDIIRIHSQLNPA